MADSIYTKNDIMMAEMRKDISYVLTEVKTINDNITHGYTPLSEFNALKDRVALLYRAFAFVMALLVAGFFAALSKGIFK